jgi:hypothetical protein
MGKVLESRDHANHIVLDCGPGEFPPQVGTPAYHWAVQDFADRWQIGWALKTPVRLTPFPDGGKPLPGPIAFLDDVVAHLETIYEGVRILRHINPEHPDPVVYAGNADPATLHELARGLGRVKGGRSRSEAKMTAAVENLADLNNARAVAGSERAERLHQLRAGGLTLAEIAAREGTALDAVKCALKRARRIEAVEAAEMEHRHAEMERRRAELEARKARFSDEEWTMIKNAHKINPKATVRREADGRLFFDMRPSQDTWWEQA